MGHKKTASLFAAAVAQWHNYHCQAAYLGLTTGPDAITSRAISLPVIIAQPFDSINFPFAKITEMVYN